MIETPVFVVLIVAAIAVAVIFRPIRNASRLTEEQDRADLAATDRRITEIEREADEKK